MITKDQFVKSINFIEERVQAEFAINKLFTEEFEDSMFFPYSKYETAYVDLLAASMSNDKFNALDDIQYFIYELDNGKRWKPGDVTVNNKDIDMSTAEKLYDYLVKELSK